MNKARLLVFIAIALIATTFIYHFDVREVKKQWITEHDCPPCVGCQGEGYYTKNHVLLDDGSIKTTVISQVSSNEILSVFGYYGNDVLIEGFAYSIIFLMIGLFLLESKEAA